MFFPTEFAKQIAITVELHPETDLWDMEDLAEKKLAELYIQKLKEFQQLALYCEIDEAMVAYTGIGINAEQKVALMLIAKSTQSWALGHVADTLLAKISTTENEKIMAQAAGLLMSSMGAGELDGKGQAAAKTLVVKLTKE